MKLIVVVTDRETAEAIAYAECDGLPDAQQQFERVNRLFEDCCDIDIRRAVMT